MKTIINIARDLTTLVTAPKDSLVTLNVAKKALRDTVAVLDCSTPTQTLICGVLNHGLQSVAVFNLYGVVNPKIQLVSLTITQDKRDGLQAFITDLKSKYTEHNADLILVNSSQVGRVIYELLQSKDINCQCVYWSVYCKNPQNRRLFMNMRAFSLYRLKSAILERRLVLNDADIANVLARKLSLARIDFSSDCRIAIPYVESKNTVDMREQVILEVISLSLSVEQ